VWARKQVSTFICPKSFISARSLAWLEDYFVWRKLGRQMDRDMSARRMEAFLILEATGQFGDEHWRKVTKHHS
jgi:hypothetical protein